MRSTILFLVLFAFASTSLSLSPNEYFERPDEFFKLLGKAATYDNWIDVINQIAAGTSDVVEKLKSIEQIGDIFGTDEDIKDLFKTFGPAFKAIVKVWKAIVPKGAAPTDEQLTDLAKKLSNAVRDIPMNKLVPKAVDPRSLMTEENIKILADLIASRPASQPGKTFMDQMKEKNNPLYCTALGIHLSGGVTKEVEKKAQGCGGAEGVEQKAGSFYLGYAFKENFENLRSEENAIGRVKAFATFVNTIKNSSNFQSFDTLYRGFSRNEHLEAFADLIREIRLCIIEQVPSEYREEWKNAIESMPSKAQQLIFFDNFPEQEIIAGDKATTLYYMIMTRLYGWGNADRDGTKLKECLLPDSDEKIYKGILLSDDATVSDAKLNEIKAKSKRARDVLFLLNSVVKAAHRRDGMSEGAKTFYKKVVTVPYIMTAMPTWFATDQSEEVLNKEQERKQKHIRDFDALTPEVKKELVKRFPHKALSVIAKGEL